MAYDLLFRKHTRRSWSIGAEPSAVDRPMAPDPLVATPEEQQVLARLAAVKMLADAGDRTARVKWKKFVQSELPATRRKALRGDANARRLLTVVEQSGLLAGVTSMVVGGAVPAPNITFSPREKQLLLFLTSVRERARAGDVRARAFGQAVKSLGL